MAVRKNDFRFFIPRDLKGSENESFHLSGGLLLSSFSNQGGLFSKRMIFAILPRGMQLGRNNEWVIFGLFLVHFLPYPGRNIGNVFCIDRDTVFDVGGQLVAYDGFRRSLMIEKCFQFIGTF